MKRYAILVLGLCAIGLAGCGIRGDLERPPPVWGPDERTPAEREHEGGETGNEDGGERR
ncbi:argininosuccinate lyase [Marinicauda algicola]|uniref:Argininosuccinate lyase n=1 Tax=Marinicauda algicola TaxID=2029849 RepID=A0A4S2H4B2_9PROT|nr:lipoprotein [Marinicauda algicola]TGY90477.1 argininosuccinate lyase [Marinicauda algicola]